MIKKIAMFGLAAAATSAFAVGNLWSISEGGNYSYQVQTPEVLACTGGDPNSMPDYGAACYQSTGGWWFAYDATKDLAGTTASVSPADKNADGTWKLITTSEDDGSILPGGNLDASKGLFATIKTTGVSGEVPGVVGLGFNWTKAESAINITANGGFCVAYNWDSADELQMELGWNSSTYGDDTWFFALPQGSKSIDIPWAQFKQEGWDKTHTTTVATATDNAVSLKFRVKNGSTTEMGGTFALSELGWQGKCSGSAPSGIADVKAVSAAKVMLNGRTLSVAGLTASAAVEVVNLRGQVVASQMMSGSAAMNLSSLDAGMYMVRVQGKSVNYTQKVILK